MGAPRHAALLLLALLGVARAFNPTGPVARWQPRTHVPTQVRMMPIGVPKVAYKAPGAVNGDWVDIYNRLYRERIMFIGQQIDAELANQVIGVMLYLDSEDASKPQYLYINSPGGSVSAGMAMFDTINHVKSDVVTINVGLAASMASFLLSAGTRGKRMGLPHSRVMIHQPMGGARGQAEDIKVEAMQIMNVRDRISMQYARLTGQPKEKVRARARRALRSASRACRARRLNIVRPRGALRATCRCAGDEGPGSRQLLLRVRGGRVRAHRSRGRAVEERLSSAAWRSSVVQLTAFERIRSGKRRCRQAQRSTEMRTCRTRCMGMKPCQIRT